MTRPLRNSIICIAVCCAMATTFYMCTSSSYPEPRRHDAQADTLAPHVTNLPVVPESADFCGEQLPLDREYVAEALDREIITNTFLHSATILIVKRAPRYFPVIEKILRENGIPDDFKYLAVAESALYTTATSPAGAVGFWQIMKDTGREYGLTINDEIDERYDLVKSTKAACDYFRKAYNTFGTWTLVAASYNGGMNRVSKVKNAQKSDSFYSLAFAEETSRYVYRIVALKTILSAPEKYGFNIPEEQKYKPYSTKSVEVDATIADLPQWASEQGADYKELRTLNPWIRSYSITVNGGKKYEILLPR